MLETIVAYTLFAFVLLFLAIGIGTIAVGIVEAMGERIHLQGHHGVPALHH